MVYDSRFRATDEAETAEVAAEVEADPTEAQKFTMAAGERALRITPPKTSTGSGDIDVLCDGQEDRGKALAVCTCSHWLVLLACRLRMASGKSTPGAGHCFLHSCLHLWRHARANALHEPNRYIDHRTKDPNRLEA